MVRRVVEKPALSKVERDPRISQLSLRLPLLLLLQLPLLLLLLLLLQLRLPLLLLLLLQLPLPLLLQLQLQLPLPFARSTHKQCVISTGATDSLIVHRVVERPPHFALAVAFAF
jgi:hypothetical protein